MKKPNLSKMFKIIGRNFSKYSPEILTGIGIAGMITTTVLAVRSTPKAVKLLEKRKAEANTEKLSAGEVVKTTWKCYVPSAITCAASVACLIGANSVHAKRTAALAAAYKLSEVALDEYKTAVEKTVDSNELEEIKDRIAERTLAKDPVGKKNDEIIDLSGDMLCYDSLSGRYFKSDAETIKSIVNDLNRQMLHEMYMPLNEFYTSIGLKPIDIGDQLGWCVDNGLIEVSFTGALTDDYRPCLVLNYEVSPKYGFDRMAY